MSARNEEVEASEEIKARLEYLRGELEAERISYEELAELQSLAKYIDKDDVQLLEPAGVPEFVPSDEAVIEHARQSICGNDEIEIDDHDHCARCNTDGPLKLSRADTGCWVAAWVYVPYEEFEE